MAKKQEKDIRQNDLAAFLANFGKWWGKFGTYVLIAALVLAATFWVVRYVRNKRAATHEGDWQALAQAENAYDLRSAAGEVDSPVVKAMALLRGAELLLNKVKAPPKDPKTAPPTDEEIEQDLKDAEHMFKRVLDTPDVDSLFHVHAHLGLGAVAESRRQWPDAADHYEAAKSKAGQRYGMLAHQATTRLQLLDSLKKTVRIAPDPLPSLTPELPELPKRLGFPFVPDEDFPLFSTLPDLAGKPDPDDSTP